MAKLGKKTHTDRPVEWKVSLPSSITVQVELLLLDPMTGKPTYGARGALITKLLQDWLEARVLQNAP